MVGLNDFLKAQQTQEFLSALASNLSTKDNKHSSKVQLTYRSKGILAFGNYPK